MWLPKLTTPGKAEALKRAVMARCLSSYLPLYIVNEFPRSGGSWIAAMLAEALGLPFPQNQMPKFGAAILHGHFLNPFGLHNQVLVWRDGRDVMVSFYYHCFVRNERGNGPLVDLMRGTFAFADYDDVTANLPAFIERSFARPIRPHFSWAVFVRRWSGREDISQVRYEAMRTEPVAELCRLVADLAGQHLDEERARQIVEAQSFARLAGRPAGDQRSDSFMRKGIVGDWTTHFNAEARLVFDRHAGLELVSLGYEPDRSWATATT